MKNHRIARPIIGGEIFEPCFIIKSDFCKQTNTRFYQLKVYSDKNDGSYELRWFAKQSLKLI